MMSAPSSALGFVHSFMCFAFQSVNWHSLLQYLQGVIDDEGFLWRTRNCEVHTHSPHIPFAFAARAHAHRAFSRATRSTRFGSFLIRVFLFPWLYHRDVPSLGESARSVFDICWSQTTSELLQHLVHYLDVAGANMGADELSPLGIEIEGRLQGRHASGAARASRGVVRVPTQTQDRDANV